MKNKGKKLPKKIRSGAQLDKLQNDEFYDRKRKPKKMRFKDDTDQ